MPGDSGFIDQWAGRASLFVIAAVLAGPALQRGLRH